MEEKKIKIRSFFERFARKYNLQDNDNIFELGFANSLFVNQLLVFIEREFNVSFKAGTLDMDKLKSINSIAETVETTNNKNEDNVIHYTLSNGLKVLCLNEYETEQFHKDIFINESYLKNGVSIKDGDCIVDVGANIGLFSLYCLLNTKNSKIYAFEVAPKVFEVLKTNLSQFQDRATLFDYGLSDKEKNAEFNFYPNNTGMSSFYADIKEEKETLKSVILNKMQDNLLDMEQLLDETLNQRLESEILSVKLRSLSEIITEHNINCIDLLKIDVQKSELDVLMGIKEQDWAKIRQVVLEVHDLEHRVEKVSNLLEKKNYKVTIEQEELYKGTINYNIYAIREG